MTKAHYPQPQGGLQYYSTVTGLDRMRKCSRYTNIVVLEGYLFVNWFRDGKVSRKEAERQKHRCPQLTYCWVRREPELRSGSRSPTWGRAGMPAIWQDAHFQAVGTPIRGQE